MAQRLFLLDGMALVYRAHFAFANRPIRTSQGFNTSALFGFTSTLLDILQNWNPTHLAVALDTPAPTPRHEWFPAYKAQREAMPEELVAALPHLRRLLDAFRIPCLALDGYEADDVIGTLVTRAEPAGFESYMVTSDKDFGQLVTEKTLLWRPGRQGGEVELLKPADVCARWGIARVDQVVDMLGLMGDVVDNIPGVPGVGEKTAAKLLAQYGSLEEVLAHADEVKGKLGENLRAHADTARLCRKLATIITDVPLPLRPDELVLRERDDDALRALCVEFEFNAIGRRLFGDDFKAGRGGGTGERRGASDDGRGTGKAAPARAAEGQGDLFAERPGTPSSPHQPPSPPAPLPCASAGDLPTGRSDEPSSETPAPGSPLKTLAEVPHDYRLVATDAERRDLARKLSERPAFCFDTETDGLDPKTARLLGVAFSTTPGTGWYVAVPPGHPGAGPGATPPPELEPFLDLFRNPRALKIGHNLKFDLAVLHNHGVPVAGPLADTMVAHFLFDPDQRHGMDFLSERYLGYTPVPIEALIGDKKTGQRGMREVEVERVAEYAAEDADVTWQLWERFQPLLKEKGQERDFLRNRNAPAARAGRPRARGHPGGPGRALRDLRPAQDRDRPPPVEDPGGGGLRVQSELAQATGRDPV
jgi:DNA polymerase-1